MQKKKKSINAQEWLHSGKKTISRFQGAAKQSRIIKLQNKPLKHTQIGHTLPAEVLSVENEGRENESGCVLLAALHSGT